MAINKVVINEDGKENILIDITDSTVEPETLAEGAVAYNRSGDRITGTMTAGGGRVDWADIENNPFDEKGDIVSWANAGIDVSTVPLDAWVKVSDAVVAIEEIIADGQFIDGADLTWYSTNTVVSAAEAGGFPAYGASDNWYVDCTEMNNGNIITPVNFRSDGVYFSKYEDFDGNLTYPLSVTLPNINKFTVVKQIETKYLPESIQLETVTLSDSLEISPIFDADGVADQEALAATDGWYRGYRRITDYSIPMELGFMHESNGQRVYRWGEYEDEYMGHCILGAYKYEDDHIYTLVVTDENGNTIDWGYYIPDGVDVGLYIDPWYAGTITSTIGAVFQIKTPKPIDKKYLPVTTWQSIQDKPFGEVAVDTFVCEENFAEKTSDVLFEVFFKVSDAVLTLEEFREGGSFTFMTPDGVVSAEIENDVTEWDGIIYVGATAENGNYYEAGCCVPEGLEYPSGFYATYYSDNEYLVSLTLNSSNKLTAFKKIPAEYLPDNIGGGMPEVTEADNGKFLRVVDGAWSAVAVPNAEGVGF